MYTGNKPKLRQFFTKNGESLHFFIYPSIEQLGIVKHAFTTRLGGVSEGIFSSLNLSFSRGDKREAVEENFRRLSEALGVSYDSFVCCDQSHTTNVVRVGKADAGCGVTR